MLRFEPPTIKQRSELAQLMAEVQRAKPQHGEASGQIRCVCGGALKFNIQSTGISRGVCMAGCWRRWAQ